LLSSAQRSRASGRGGGARFHKIQSPLAIRRLSLVFSKIADRLIALAKLAARAAFPEKSENHEDFSLTDSNCSINPIAFDPVGAIVIVWLITGPLFGFSDTRQLVINTGSSIVTFLMVFLIQNTQNRDSAAIHIKLDELIRSSEGAHSAFLNLEELDQRELDRIRGDYLRLAQAAREKLQENSSGTLGVSRPKE
jgi:low affinity Fe/Cu permease